MQLIYLPNIWTILMNIIAWYVFHMSISLIARNIPNQFFEKNQKCFRTRKWEKAGTIWQKLFRVRSWKPYLPDGTKITNKGFDKTHLKHFDQAGLQQFVLETRRGEFAHWLMIPPALLFFLWNPPWAGWIMVTYAFVANFPFIIVQRYNRPRLERLVQRKEQLAKEPLKEVS